MKRNLFILGLALSVMFSFSSCSEDDPGGGGEESGNVVVTANITSDTEWTADNIYELGGRIAVEDGATLTIEAGTVIKGQAGSGASATALLVARGGTLIAEGTASLPIIFTTVADEITPEQVATGDFSSPNLNPDQNGLWGGLIVLGKAPISAKPDAGDTEAQIEGIPASDLNGRYGGNVADDNSGILKYISLRHGGTNIGAGNEINGLSLGGVGSGTTIEHIEIVSNQDDGVEWFGGTVDVSNVVVWNVGDDGIDTDQAWAGTLDNFAVITPAGHCFELDGPEGTLIDGHKIMNGLIVSGDWELDDGDTSAVRISEDLINTDKNSIVDLTNLFITGRLDGAKFNVGAEQKINRTVDNPDVKFGSIVISVWPGNSINDHVKDGDAPAGVQAGTQPATAINLTGLSWTWASQDGQLDGLY
jgi:hypothetical protein